MDPHSDSEFKIKMRKEKKNYEKQTRNNSNNIYIINQTTDK